MFGCLSQTNAGEFVDGDTFNCGEIAAASNDEFSATILTANEACASAMLSLFLEEWAWNTMLKW